MSLVYVQPGDAGVQDRAFGREEQNVAAVRFRLGGQRVGLRLCQAEAVGDPRQLGSACAVAGSPVQLGA